MKSENDTNNGAGSDCQERFVRLLWGRTTPTENGYYWYREHVQHRAVIYDVAACERFGFAQKWDGSTMDVKLMTGWWAGPIPKPEPPSLPNDAGQATASQAGPSEIDG